MTNSLLDNITLDLITPKIGSLDSRTSRIIHDQKFMDYVCTHISSGGSLIDLCEGWGIKYGDAMNYIGKDKDRQTRFYDARNNRSEWAEQKIILELTRMMSVDIREAYDEHGALKPVAEWSHELASIVAGIESKEDFQKVDGKMESSGMVHKLKLRSKEKAIELYGKNLKLFNEKVDHSVSVKLEDLIGSVPPRAPKDIKK